MKVSILYTALSVLNLIAFAIVVAFLPASVPVHFENLTVDRFGSAWVFIAFPAVTALLSLGVLMLRLKAKERGREYLNVISLVIAAVGAVFACVGWTFVGLSSQSVEFGMKVSFPYAAVTALPLSMAMFIFGFIVYDGSFTRLLSAHGAQVNEALRKRADRAGGIFFMIAAGIAAILAVVFACLTFSPRADWVAIVVLAVLGAFTGTQYFILFRATIK